jgi:hypothetical protein
MADDERGSATTCKYSLSLNRDRQEGDSLSHRPTVSPGQEAPALVDTGIFTGLDTTGLTCTGVLVSRRRLAKGAGILSDDNPLFKKKRIGYGYSPNGAGGWLLVLAVVAAIIGISVAWHSL